MDEYDKKFAEMQKYIPFLEAMILRLQNVKDKDNREIQLQKMQSLLGILSNNKRRKLKIETLERCEDVLQKLYNKVEKFQGNTPGLQLSSKHRDFTSQPSTSRANWCQEAEQSQDKEIIEETPASPDTARSSSPDCQILPIVIPTERDKEQNKDKRQKQRSKIIPIITLTDNTKTITISSPSEAESNADDVTYTEWDMLEESERHSSRNRENRSSSLIATSHDVLTAAKLISDSLPQKVSDNRSYELNPQDILTVPVPSLGGSRRLSSVLEKSKLSLSSLNINIADSSRPESPVNVPEVRLNSPDPEILFAKPTTSSPKPKDSHNTSKPPSKPPSIPLLFSPPLSHEPPLSMEDLAELLNEGDGKNDNGESENATKKKQETDKTSKNLSLSEREKLTTRKNLPNTAGTLPMKSSATSSIGPSHQSNDSHRSTSIFQEPRYADNYERHPRQRDAHSHESTKDKSTSSPIILDEISPQISILHNAANKPNERNSVPLYQRRPPEGWKETNLPRQENEFIIDNTDYYNMHTNQMHWSSPTAISDHQFGNTQWTPSTYGMTNPLQPTQHPFQHPMEPQFRQNQFPPALPTGPRPLINPAVRPQEMSHVRPENIREDIPSSIPPGFSSQYRGFQMGQGSYDPGTVGRPTEYPHVRPTWEGSANRVNETNYENVISCGIQVVENSTGISYPRPNTPCPWGTRDRPNRGQGRDGYYERNRTEVRPNFNRDVRRTDWSRDGHSDRENLNRFPNRDPRVRTEHNVTSANQAKDTGFSARDPRLAKDKHVNSSTKDTVHYERDPRIRDPKPAKTTMTKEKPCSQKLSEKDKLDKLPKDRMQSPLESLYGVIDTKASQNSGLHKFKIPKIKRPEPPSRIINEKNTENTSKPSRAKSSSSKNNKLSFNKNKDVASAEVSSSSDGNHITENPIQQNDAAKEGKIISSSFDNEIDLVANSSKSSDVTKKNKKKNESDAHGSKLKYEELIETLIRKSFEVGTGKTLVEQAKLIQELTKAISSENYKKVEKIIKTSEKLKKSESESTSDKDEMVEVKKTQIKKKRRVIVSDSSDDECLAERLGILNTDTDTNEREMVSAISTHPKNSEKKLEVTASSSNSSKDLINDITTKENSSLKTCDEKHVQIDNNSKTKDVQLKKKNDKNDRLENGNENIVQSESEKLINSEDRLEDEEKKQIEDNQDKIDQSTVEEKSTDSVENSIECMDQNSTKNNTECLDQGKDQTTQSVTDIADQTDQISTDKPKTKTRRRNSLEMLQEDIREMFISEDVVTATGYRMCRLSKEGQPPSGISTSSTNSKKDESSNTAEKKIVPNIETSELVTSNKSKKSLKSRNIGESSKPKAKNTRLTRNLRLQKSFLNSDSEEDQPLALRTEKLRNTTPNREVDHSEESNDALCKSKRIMCKDIIKEPRVLVEKTDISKLESKVMFDSSSDESFGIDVSELAAAVDNSLRPDKFDQDSVETGISPKRQKNVKNASKRKSKKSSALIDNKSENESFTDEESVISDISMSSSTTVMKRTGGAARTTTKEELLSNILVGLTSTTEKNTLTDKGNEADYEEDVTDLLAIEPSTKKTLVKKKKKKSSWQMGIVTTKKKKKKTSSKTAQMSVEEKNTETNISTDTKQADQSIVGNNKSVTANKIEKILGSDHAFVDDANIDLMVKRELNEINSLVNTDNFGADFKDLGNFTALSESSNTILKEETLINESFSIEESKPIKEEVEDFSSTDLITASAADVQTDTSNKFFKESPKIIYDELMTELFHRIDIKHLINYAWAGQDKYKCLLCFFTGKNIVYHYKVMHPGKEVLISRLKSTDAKTAIMETEHSSMLASTAETNQMCKFRCRFCCFVTEGAADVALEAFYEHCTTHTGEYRFHCNNCSYQAVAKASMRTHYYKVCRKDAKTFNESASEDVIPREGGIYGYLCCSCNYVQLKRQNVETHMAFWHREQIGTEILKINMSISDEHATSNNEKSHESESVNAEESFTIETKPQVPELQCEAMPLMDNTRSAKSVNKDATNECILLESKTKKNLKIKQEAEERPKLSQKESEGPVVAGNLSVFVVPPELENKDIEIQRERQKTMQEIANNIGISLKNSKPGLSIIDKLQNKMRTDAVVSPVPECDTPADIPKTKENPSVPFVSAFEPLKSEELIINEDPLIQPSSQEDPLSLTGKQLVVDTSEVTNDESDKVDVKIRDPLMIMDSCKNNESDGENSDNEHSAPIFESDYSSEQSDSEQTDVNVILKETSNMNTSSLRDPMLTTIQRLAAQLQNTKPLEQMPEPMLDIKVEIKTEPMSVIPKPPDVVPIANNKRLLTKQQNANSSKKETLTPTSCKNANSSKNFIRPRRLSGDMLSVPTQSSDNQEDPQKSNKDGVQLDSAIDAQQTDTEEECSFLKIENVVSLAPGSNESIIVNDIRKAVEISPTKNKEISILRKTNQPLILKKIILPQSLVNTSMQGKSDQEFANLSVKSIGTHLISNSFIVTPKQLVVPSSTSPSALNCRQKKIQVIRTFLPSGISTKEITPVTINFKSPNAYTSMLMKPKLCHFYKCMEPNCDFTTDVEIDYSQHYLKHYVDSSKQNNPVSRDYEKCAYCNTSLKDWISMKTHLWEKHSHCRYQCGYCFYRAIVPAFVQHHQTTCHPGTESCILLGKMLKPAPKQENINRTEYIMPFVCKLDCGKIFYIPETFITHLKTKHPTSLRYRCHLCNSTYFTIELLMSHYRLHEYSKYQCLYCLCGRDNLNEMHQHLSSLHNNRLAQFLERSLPATPSHDKSVIQQLLVRMFDQKTIQGDIGLNADDAKKNTTKKYANQISTALLNVKSVLNEARSNPPNNSRKDDVIGTVNDNLKNIEVNVTNVLTKLSADVSLANANKKTRNGIAEKPVQKEPSLQSETKKLSDCATNQILREPQLELLSSKNDSNTINSNPIEFLGDFNCSDEFVNTNLLDNAELFKKFTPNSNNLSKATDKTDDSDIEILESEEKIAQENVENNVNKITKEAVLKSKIDIVDENIKEQVAPSDTTETERTPTDVLADKSASVLADKSAGVLADKSAGVLADKSAGVLADKSAGVLADKSAGVLADKSADVSENVSADVSENVSADVSENVSADVSENVSENVSADVSENVSADVSENVSTDVSENVSADVSENVSADVSENVSADVSENVSADVSENVSADVSENVSADVLENVSADVSEDMSEDVSADVSEDVSADQPLTLDDIKDTGRVGHDLYKCGYMDCNFTASNAILLKTHIKKCNLVVGEPIKNLFCPHCKKRFVKIGLLLEHMKTHGLKRFGCSLCKLRYSVSYQATAHMKQKHKLFNPKLVPADPTNPSADGLFIVHATPHASERRSKKRRSNRLGTEQENEKSADNEKLSFSPDEIEQLPRQAIYNREVQCAVCPYTTKVRTNIVRHLKLHAKDESVPESGPVNPVPCLDKKEKMFDKMVNLASSSHQNGRMGPKPREPVKESEEDDTIPKFVPEHKRYVCSVAECNYLTVDEAMLRYHLKALHSEEPYFRCPHCPSPPPGQENHIAIDKMGIHLKMHDTRLYKCSHCNHHHYHRHVVERHLTDKHPEKRPFVKVIREIENTENVQQPVQEETEEEVPDPDGNHWKCNLCDFKCVYKADAATHADTVHGESSQYKCTVCSFKTSGKILLEQHINNKHTYDTKADYTMIYQRIKGVNKRNTEVVEQSGQDEPFDTTPLWRRNMPRVRHIRGILLEEETEESPTSETFSTTSKVSLGKRKNDAEMGAKPAKIKSTGKSTSLDENNKQYREKLKRSFSCEADGERQIMKENAQGKFDSRNVIGNKLNKDLGELSDSDMGRFGPYGKPEGNMYVCTLCNHFKTKYKHDMRDHLYRELKYPRWHCKVCGYLSVNRKSLLQHFGKRHNGESPEHEPLTPDNSIEDWVTTLLKRQSDMIKATLRGINVHKSTSSSSPDTNLTKISSDKKTVNLAPTISNLQNDILEDANRGTIDTDDGDSQDEDLVIDMKEDEDRSNDELENDKLREKTDDDLEKPIICKHCQVKFTRQRGFKMHVQYSHLKRFGFLCPYCDRSSNSEVTIRQHVRAKHPNEPEKFVQNADTWGNSKLNDKFWEKEYGLSPQKPKKRKLNPENNATSSTAVTASAGNRVEKCKMCNFTAANYTGLKSHMRTHTYKHKFKCLYCTYSCLLKAEMLEHCDLNHPSVPWKFKELSSAGSSSVETKNKPSTSQKQDVDASKNVEEELCDPAQTIYYGCFYCDLRSNSLPSIKQHWNLIHKDSKSSNNTVSAKFPFRYKEISVQKLSYTNSMKKKVTTLDKTKQAENLSPIVQQHGWICEWCQEFCATDSIRVRHQNMYHSHLPHKWQKQQQQAQDQSKDTLVRLPVSNFEKYATNSKTVPSFESVLERLKHVRQTESNDMKNDQSSMLDISTSEGDSSDGPHGIARKSTTKSVIPCAKPGPRVFKAVARKSTNPRPSIFTPHLSAVDSTDTEFEEDMEEEEEEITRSKAFSYYGIPSSPINLAELNTYMVVGGHSMRVNCMTLATLIDIKPKVLLKDIKKDPKYAASLSNLD
ncbi:uncharacterized protein LOC105202475 isoform X3 [Solenopsis invicta]|uniref:uncharacterized protein LOC105202475 isoform X3 n=1 Tax=Solenopsis invicta TaxID=13686 RepID=UPI00193DC37F|nr:uncharacterized protein LOC105202475 isoform X3 [Solenopsis invicta]